MPVVQSSGTGKSRMLTELGRTLFTLPICLRSPDRVGYPLSDEPVYCYFQTLWGNQNDLSISGHIAIASFIAAAHTTMLGRLQTAQTERNFDHPGLVQYWHSMMEGNDEGGVSQAYRRQFFLDVVQQAEDFNKEVHNQKQCFSEDVRRFVGLESPKLVEKGEPSIEILAFATQVYKIHAEQATVNLCKFLDKLKPAPGETRLYVMYFDEADEPGNWLWIIMRIIHCQDKSIPMWYIFMGTRSSFQRYNPPLKKLSSLGLELEAELVKPYISMGFDQRIRHGRMETETVQMKELYQLAHFCKYGRPLWGAHLHESPKEEVLAKACLKLISGSVFRPDNKDQVFAVLSQRMCLDPVLSQEAIELADRSVSHHMRLLTGYSTKEPIFHTHSPSEPVLALAACEIMYRDGLKNHVPMCHTLTQSLCSAGLVERGLMGELGARLLLLLARDLTVLNKNKVQGLLKPALWEEFPKPVELLQMLETLLGKNWAGEKASAFNDAFGEAYVNFTHWMMTEEALPEEPDRKLLANLWARGAALQCSHNQESIDMLIVSYHGSIAPDAVFDPAFLSGLVVQVKLRKGTHAGRETTIQPVGIARDRLDPLPYLSLLLELGTQTQYHEGGWVALRVAERSEKNWSTLLSEWADSVKSVAEYEDGLRKAGKKKGKDKVGQQKKDKMKKSRAAMDAFKRYSISIRGTDSYAVLNLPGWRQAFQTLLEVTERGEMGDELVQQMWPLRQLGDSTPHGVWMRTYVRDEDCGVE
ncbi:hypothetical protein JB92DRAFT_1266106 [Gautieria morchelliformis]|nr:hypothetical protein JB92DRAFT_1266106 [Gautieria morchelliformis]